MPDFSRIYNYIYQAREMIGAVLSGLWDYFNFRVLFLTQLFVNGMAWFLASYIVRNVGQPQIALHYSVDFGIDLYDEADKVFIVPFLGMVFIIFNALVLGVIEKFAPRETAFSMYLMLGAALMANLILLAALASIYLINFR